MTPEQERALLAAAEAGLDDEVRDAFRDLMALIAAGVVPREAVQTVMATFQGEMASTMAAALSAIMGASVGAEAVVALEVGAVQLSRRVYLEAQAVGDAVQGIVQRHALGWQDARRLALEMFEGYGFRDPDAEPLKIDPSNPRLPQYLRDALLPDELLRTGIERELAKLQVANLSTPALRAAYSDVLSAFDAMEGVEGQALLEKRLEVAFFERVRYWATRIARTELHRAYAEREARLLLDDPDVEFVQIRRAPGRGEPCICVLMTGRDLYGLGPGVYPKALAPVPPFHPFCRCVQSPRLDLTGRTAEDRDADGDAYFLRRLDNRTAARIMGSQGRRDRVLEGATAEAVTNSTREPLYHIRTAGALGG